MLGCPDFYSKFPCTTSEKYVTSVSFAALFSAKISSFSHRPLPKPSKPRGFRTMPRALSQPDTFPCFLCQLATFVCLEACYPVKLIYSASL